MAKQTSHDRVSIRVTPTVLAALDMIGAKQRAATGRAPTFSETLWRMIETYDPAVYTEIRRIAEESGTLDDEDTKA